MDVIGLDRRAAATPAGDGDRMVAWKTLLQVWQEN